MVAPKALVLSHSRTPRTRATPSINSMAMTGKAACWRSVRIGSLVHPVVVTKAVAGLEVVWDVEGLEAVLVVVEVALGEATADVVATEVEEVATVVRLPAASMTLLLLQALLLLHQIPLPTTLRLEEK